MLNKSLAMLVVILMGANVQAQTEVNEAGLPVTSDMQSEFFFQAPAGHSDLSLRLGYGSATLKSDEAGSDEYKVNGLTKTGVAYEYGINDMWAVEGALYFKSVETDTDPKLKESGLENPEVVLKGTSKMDWGHLRFGTAVGLGFEKSKTADANRDGNAATGGYSLMPYIGADMNAAGGILGGRLAYEYLMERTIDDGSGEDIKDTKGHEVLASVFYEQFFADMLIGGSVNYASSDAVDQEQGGVKTEKEGSHTTTGISLYSRMPMGSWALIPRLDYDFSRSHFTKYDVLEFSVTARLGF